MRLTDSRQLPNLVLSPYLYDALSLQVIVNKALMRFKKGRLTDKLNMILSQLTSVVYLLTKSRNKEQQILLRSLLEMQSVRKDDP